MNLTQSESTFLKTLAADGPDPVHAQAMQLFGQFAGSWEHTWRFFDGRENASGSGQWHFGWVLQGRAVQDVFIAYNADGSLYDYGSTIRVYDPAQERWNIAYLGPLTQTCRTFTARMVEDEIVLEGRNADGHLIHWIFSEITSSTFRWRGEISENDGLTWRLYEEMRLKRRT
jgi:hypothetical protein